MPSAGGPAARAATAGLAVLLLLAACTGDDGGAGPSTTAGPPADGGTFRLGLGGDLVVDPLEASLASPSELMVLDLLHDGLTRMDAEGVPQPDLATAWESNDEHTVFQFRLDPEGSFASGAPLTPAVVVASLERVMKLGDRSLVALSLEAVKGFRAFATGEAEHVSGLSVRQGGIVRFELATPLSVLPQVLSDPLLSVVDPATIAEASLADVDLSGGWSVASADAQVARLERQDDTPGHVAAVELRTFEDIGAAYGAFEDGEVDWAAVPTDRYEDAVDAYGDGAFAPFHAELFFGMNVKSKSLESASLRAAISLAIDRDAIVDAVYAELADPLTTVVPRGVPGHDPDRCDACAHDPEQAADIIELAYPDGTPTVRIDFDQSAAQQEMAELVAEDLEDVGITTELRPQPFEAYKEFVVSGDQELFSFGWIGAYRSPDAYLAPLFGSAANDNLTRYRSQLVDGYLLEARADADPENLAARWAQAEGRVLNGWVVVPIAQFRTQVVVGERVEGFAHAVDGTVDWSEVTLTS